MIDVADLALFREQDPDQPYMASRGFLWRYPAEPDELVGPSFPLSLVVDAARLNSPKWAGVLQMPGFVMGASGDPYSFSLRVDGKEIGRARIASWHESKLPNRAAVALLFGEGECPALLDRE